MGCLVNGDCVDGSLCLDATLTCGPAHCQDGQRNGNETDVDCGGGECPGCGAGLACVFCAIVAARPVWGPVMMAQFPVNVQTIAPMGIVNGSETDTDCGGSCENVRCWAKLSARY